MYNICSCSLKTSAERATVLAFLDADNVDDAMFDAGSRQERQHVYSELFPMAAARRHSNNLSPTPSSTSFVLDATSSLMNGIDRLASTKPPPDLVSDGLEAETENSLLIDSTNRCQGQGQSSGAPVARRRAVDASDLRQCALVQTKMKALKSGCVDFCYHVQLVSVSY